MFTSLNITNQDSYYDISTENYTTFLKTILYLCKLGIVLKCIEAMALVNRPGDKQERLITSWTD